MPEPDETPQEASKAAPEDPPETRPGHDGGMLSPGDDAKQDDMPPGFVPGTLDSRG